MRRRPASARWLVALALLAGFAAAADAAGVARRVRDINTGTQRHRGGPCWWGGPPLALGGATLFSAQGSQTGCELYRTAGDPAGSGLVRDILLGGAGSEPWLLGALHGLVLFSADTPESGRELWRSDGTGAGTVLVEDLWPGPGALYGGPRQLVSFGSYALFAGEEPDSGWELWRTDGTAAGTSRVVDLRPGPDSSLGDELMVPAGLGGVYYFVADDGVAGAELWRSDGTAAGTARVLDLVPGPAGSNPTGLTVFEDRILFWVTDWFTSLAELWISDGSAAGTLLLRAYDDVGLPGELVAASGRVYFVLDGQFWATDGTAAGTAAFAPAPDEVYALRALGARVCFFGRDAAHGVEPWVSDGTSAGTHRLADLRPGPEDSTNWGEFDFTAAGGVAVFAADDGTHGAEIWATDGTSAGTFLLAEIVPGPEGSNPAVLKAVGTRVVFSATTAEFGRELYATDGTPAGTARWTSLGGLASESAPAELTDAGGRLFFGAWDGSSSGPWRSEGTEATTVALAGDLGAYSDVHDFTLLPGGAVVAIGSGDWDTAGDLIWSTEGDAIEILGTFEYGCHVRTCGLRSGLHAAGPGAVFAWGDPPYEWELWATDGTAAGTGPLADIAPGAGSSSPYAFGEFFDRVVFVADDGVHGGEPWITDGTAATTHLLVDLVPGAAGSDPGGILPFEPSEGSFYFTRPGDGVELWFFDAQTEAATRVAAGFDYDHPRWLGVVGARLLFAGALEGGEDEQLWSSDGTVAGTGVVIDTWPGPSSSWLLGGARLGDRLYFRACEPATGCELWSSDGTAANTFPVFDLVPGPGSSLPTGLSAIGGRLYFAACQVATGCEPWASDGTAAGTHRVADLSPGPESSLGGSVPPFDDGGATEAFVESGRWIFFAADDGTGAELWAMPPEIFYDGFETGNVARWSAP